MKEGTTSEIMSSIATWTYCPNCGHLYNVISHCKRCIPTDTMGWEHRPAIMRCFRTALLCLAIWFCTAGVAYCEDIEKIVFAVPVPLTPGNIEFVGSKNNSIPIMKISKEGKLWLNPDCTTKEIAQEFVGFFETYFNTRLNVLRQENALLKAKIEKLEGGVK